MKFRTLRTTVLLAAVTIVFPALGQTPGGPGDLSPHIDVGVDADTGQLVFGFTDIEANTPIVIDNFVTTLPGGGGGFTNIPFTADQDIAFRTASDTIATDLGFTSFGQFGQGSPQIAAEAVELDPFFQAFAFPTFVDAPGESFILNVPGQFIDFHPTYILATGDADFIGRVEGTFRFVPLTSTGVFSPSETFDFIFVVGGDFDDDSRLTPEDRALLEAAIAAGDNPAEFELTGDDLVDDADLDFWLTELLGLPAAGLIGDFSGDGFVGQDDLNLILLNFGDTVLPEGFDEAGLDPATSPGGVFDGILGQNELNDVLLNFGNSAAPGVAAVPEPGTAGALAALALIATRRRRRKTSGAE
ncbi:MAG: PEP-CTERM sorting domain-containing protein [Planctomycetota bacterium]